VVESKGQTTEPSKLHDYEQAPAQTAAQHWRFVVAQATGVLMARDKTGADAAIVKLAAQAAETNRPLLDVAREIVEDVNRSASNTGHTNDNRPHD
jgi:AmiR/NasT family two-component response regulator